MDTAQNMTDGFPPEGDPLDIVQADSPLEAAADELLDDSFHQQVAEHLRELLSPKKSWRRNLMVLGVTVALFIALGLVESTFSFVMVLVGVLLVHESGHYLGMRLFGYRNVRMFFIPLFGAAVSGIETQVSPLKKGIVLLLGPVPGIVLAAILAFVYRAYYPGPWLYEVVILLVCLNAFNLLPLLPLDGGRLFHLVLFSRNRHLEAAFSLLASLGLIGIGWILSVWLLVGLGALMLFGVSRGLSTSRIAKAIRSGPLPCSVESEDDVPPAYVAAIAERILIEKPQLKKLDAGPRHVAQWVQSVWEKLSNDPPGIVTSLLLLSVYVFALAISPLALFVLHATTSTVVYDASGQSAPREELFYAGEVYEWTEVGPDLLYHGRFESYSIDDPKSLEIKGQWDHGFEDGDWSYYRQGEVYQIVTYDHGKVVVMKVEYDDGWTTLQRDELEDDFLSQYFELSDQPRGPEQVSLWPEPIRPSFVVVIHARPR